MAPAWSFIADGFDITANDCKKMFKQMENKSFNSWSLKMIFYFISWYQSSYMAENTGWFPHKYKKDLRQQRCSSKEGCWKQHGQKMWVTRKLEGK